MNCFACYVVFEECPFTVSGVWVATSWDAKILTFLGLGEQKITCPNCIIGGIIGGKWYSSEGRLDIYITSSLPISAWSGRSDEFSSTSLYTKPLCDHSLLCGHTQPPSLMWPHPVMWPKQLQNGWQPSTGTTVYHFLNLQVNYNSQNDETNKSTLCGNYGIGSHLILFFHFLQDELLVHQSFLPFVTVSA